MINELSKGVLEELSNSITRVFYANSIEILFTKAELKYVCSKKGPNNLQTLSLFIDGRKCVVKGTKVEYKCKCGSVHTILLKKFLCKKVLNCVSCKETKEKSLWHSRVMCLRKSGIDIAIHRKYEAKYHYSFEDESEDFKQRYWNMSKNLTEKEFMSVVKYIYSIDGHELSACESIKHLPHEPCYNQKRYTPVVLLDGVRTRLVDIVLKCPYCGKLFRISRGFKKRITEHNFDCAECTFTNKVFKRRRYRDNLFYQSNLEKRFIERCDNLNIDIFDGPEIRYKMNDDDTSVHIYTTDFELPEYKIVVEIKDNHIWHKRQVESGKWKSKSDAAEAYCKQNGYSFVLLFPSDFDVFFETLSSRDSLNNHESG